MAKDFWRCPEFSSRKQVGDLAKRMSLLKQKNDSMVFNLAGCRGGEGVSTVIMNLANYLVTYAGDAKALLVDANFGNPVLHHALDKSLGRGLSDVLQGASSWSETVSSTGYDNLHFLSAGESCPQMEGNLEAGKLGSMMTEIRGMYDYVLIDSPALLASSDAVTLSVVSDATFLVIQSLSTPKEVAERARALLEDNECLIGGALLNRVKQVIPGWMYRLL